MTWFVSFAGVVCDRMTAALSAAQTGRRGGAGPAGGLLGGKDPAGRLLQDVPYQHPGEAVGASKITGRDHFPAGPRHQAGEDADVDAGFQKMHRAVGEDRIRPAGVKAVDLSVIRAVDGTRPRLRSPVVARALAEGQGPPDPGARPYGVGPRNRPARTPQLGPAGVFGDQERLRSAVRNVGEARQVVRPSGRPCNWQPGPRDRGPPDGYRSPGRPHSRRRRPCRRNCNCQGLPRP